MQRMEKGNDKDMKKALIVIDMQNDFIDGSLGTEQAQAITMPVAEKIKQAEQAGTEIIFTMDTHGTDYADTQEGKCLPVPHCIKDTEGWQLAEPLRQMADGKRRFCKSAFGSTELGEYLRASDEICSYDEIELVGLCTDICVISNALLIKAYLPETPISVDAACCAGVTPESHENALRAMQMCQINIKP